MSMPDINQLLAQASLFLQNPQAFEKVLESLNMPEEQKAHLRSMLNQLFSGNLKPDQNFFNQINQMLSGFAQAGLPPEMGNVESIMEMIKNTPPKK